MNTNDTNTQRQQPETADQQRDDEKFWADWWREYAQTWK